MDHFLAREVAVHAAGALKPLTMPSRFGLSYTRRLGRLLCGALIELRRPRTMNLRLSFDGDGFGKMAPQAFGKL